MKKHWTHTKYPNRAFSGTYIKGQNTGKRIFRLTSEDMKPVRKMYCSPEAAKERGWKYA